MATSQKTETPFIFLPTWYVYSIKMVCGIQESKVNSTCRDVKRAPDNGAILSRGIYSTEVNIYNYNEAVSAHITKYYVQLVRENKVIGFEPEIQREREIAKIILEPGCATGDDCCIISGLLKTKNVLNIGFLKIVSSTELAVTAVYTAADVETNNVVSMDVEQINSKILHSFRPKG